ncbi:MAG: DNA helicase RecQ [Robiginitomaculum sp.]|nr:MAG: DNA helicase RecQ [Robiginitomaculum sp.]
MQSAQQLLCDVFGYADFRLHQRDVIACLLAGQDALCLMPTGGGKSLCYQIPAMVMDGVGVIISPLIALMQDQVSALKQLGVRADFLNSSQTQDQQDQVKHALLQGQLDLLYVSPERLMTGAMLDLLGRTNLALFAIDEAHCVSQWGHDFRKEYQQLSVLHQRFPDTPRLAVTATADARTRTEIITELDLHNARRFIASFDRPNIRYAITDEGSGREQLWNFLQTEHATDSGIVYCLSRNKVEDITRWLSQKGRVALPYHAGLDAKIRQHNQSRFLRDEGIIMVATIAFGMGVDKPDVRFVAHLNLPKSIESYYQETGRAGRDGEAANAWMHYGINDVVMQRKWLEQSDAAEHHKQVQCQKLDALLGLCEMTTCRRQSLLGYFDEALREPCGNCDNCLHPPKTFEATHQAQLALSAIYRTGQRFGAVYITEVLTGKQDQRILANGHDHLQVFGMGKDHTALQWRSILRQLIARNLIVADPERHNGLRLDTSARPVLRGEIQIFLRTLKKPSRKNSTKATTSIPVDLAPGDEALWNALKAKRLELAKAQSIPPYIIFHDKTLRQMASDKPLCADDLDSITGIGQSKRERYGQVFLDVIARFV